MYHLKRHYIGRIVLVSTVLSLFALSIHGCKDEPGPITPNREYELVWSDEFDGEAGDALDASKWTYDLGRGINGWGNNELQAYTKEAKNVSLDGDGHLVISAIKESDGSYTSARIKTEGLFEQQYGRIEARIKTPTGPGIWPAFWMLGDNFSEIGWPTCGEIDIMEQQGQKPFITHGSLHGPGYSAGNAVTDFYRLETGRFDSDYYTYAVEWGADYIDFFLNDSIYHRVTPSRVPGDWVYTHPFFIILNVAVGGNFVGPPNETTSFPTSMSVDYVRVYKEK